MSEKKSQRTDRAPRERSYGARLAGACLYALLIIVISGGYALWLWKKAK